MGLAADSTKHCFAGEGTSIEVFASSKVGDSGPEVFETCGFLRLVTADSCVLTHLESQVTTWLLHGVT